MDKRTNVENQRRHVAAKKAQVRRQEAGSNRPPDGVRFILKPTVAVRQRLKDAGWLYDPVAAIWHLPDDPVALKVRITVALSATLELAQIILSLGIMLAVEHPHMRCRLVLHQPSQELPDAV